VARPSSRLSLPDFFEQLWWLLQHSLDFNTAAASDVRTFVANHLGVNVSRVTDEAHFTDDLGANWLDRLDLMIAVEDQFAGVEITDDDVDRMELVGDLIRHIENLDSERRRRGAAPVVRNLFGPRLPRAMKPSKHRRRHA
jgi:acyl carrier protein